MRIRLIPPRCLPWCLALCLPVLLLPAVALAAAPGAGSGQAAPPAGRAGCLHGAGYLRARIRGALERDLAWTDARLDCDGELRPDGSGVRLSFAGPLERGRRLRLVFGVRGVREGAPGKELPTNLTVMEEGGRIFATRGEDKCTVDSLSQLREPDAADPDGARAWRITARGFCIEPANALGQDARIVVSRFDFTGVVRFGGRG